MNPACGTHGYATTTTLLITKIVHAATTLRLGSRIDNRNSPELKWRRPLIWCRSQRGTNQSTDFALFVVSFEFSTSHILYAPLFHHHRQLNKRV